MSYIKVILLEDLKNFGLSGDIVNVKRGYANNYLIPFGIAAHSGNYEVRKKIDEYKKNAMILREKKLKEANEMKEKINGTLLKISAIGSESGKLFGSVKAKAIANKINSIHNTELCAKNILIPEPIKEIGFYEINVEPFDGIVFTVNLEVYQEMESKDL